MINKDLPLILKNPAGPAVVIVVGRLSKPKATLLETLQTIEASMNAAKEHLEAAYKGSIDFRYLGKQMSGMVVDRKTIHEIYDLVESGKVDLVICEELRCVYRNPRLQYAFVQDMFDLQTRFISIVDDIDTAA
jgi:DNA invertase Pin-like site-specific DNA recombinase